MRDGDGGSGTSSVRLSDSSTVSGMPLDCVGSSEEDIELRCVDGSSETCSTLVPPAGTSITGSFLASDVTELFETRLGGIPTGNENATAELGALFNIMSRLRFLAKSTAGTNCEDERFRRFRHSTAHLINL